MSECLQRMRDFMKVYGDVHGTDDRVLSIVGAATALKASDLAEAVAVIEQLERENAELLDALEVLLAVQGHYDDQPSVAVAKAIEASEAAIKKAKGE